MAGSSILHHTPSVTSVSDECLPRAVLDSGTPVTAFTTMDLSCLTTPLQHIPIRQVVRRSVSEPRCSFYVADHV